MSEVSIQKLERTSPLDIGYEALSRPAAHTKAAIEYMRDHPFSTREELLRASGIEFAPPGFSELSVLVDLFVDRRADVTAAHQLLQNAAINSHRRPADVLYGLTAYPVGSKPEGKPEMSFRNDPFAVCLSVTEDDFTRFHSRDVGGYFQYLKSIELNGRNVHFPFIALSKVQNPKEYRRRLNHEQKHAYNNLVYNALWKAKKLHHWGAHTHRLLWSLDKLSGRINEQWSNLTGVSQRRIDPVKGIQKTTSWKTILSYAQTWTKDEILARLGNNDDFGGIDARFGNYDRIDSDFELPRDLSDLMWSHYLPGLTEEVKQLQLVRNMYQEFDFQAKLDLLPWMLMRVPFDQWKIALDNSGITEEVKWLEKLRGLKEQHARVQDVDAMVSASIKPLQKVSDRLVIADLRRAFGQLNAILPSLKS